MTHTFKARSSSANNIRITSTDHHDLFKFINQSNRENKSIGKKCNPHQLFGVSSQSPDHFQLQNSLVAKNGYKYTIDDSKVRKNFTYLSQKHFITLASGAKFPTSKQKTKYQNQFMELAESNKQAFHRRKGKLCDFIDKNKYMGDTYKIMGAQRSQQARKLRIQCKDKELINKKIVLAQPNSENKKLNKNVFSRDQSDKIGMFSSHESMKNMLMNQKIKVEASQQKLRNLRTSQSQRKKNYQEQRMTERPFTSSRNQQMQKSIFEATTSKFKPTFGGSQQFNTYLPDWNNNDFKINLIEWEKQADQCRGQTVTQNFSNTKTSLSTRDNS